MTISYKWSIVKLQVTPEFQGKNNVVTQAEWLCDGVDADSKLSASVAGVKALSLGNTFTAYNQLTEAEVLDWCTGEETVSVTDEDGNVNQLTRNLKVNVEQQIATEFARQLAEKALESKLPWL
jgi:hypothetical protein